MVRWLAFVCAAAALAACHTLVRDYQTPDDGTAGAGGGGGGGGGGGMTAGVLNDSGLVVRYFLDEAGSGRDPVNAVDHAREPLLNLDVDYGVGGSGGGWLAYSEEAQGRGLSWPALDASGVARSSIDGTKVADALLGAKTATIEVVMRADEVDAAGSTVFRVLGSANGITLLAWTMGNLRFTFDGIVVGDWTVELQPRTVIHVVINTALGEGRERVTLFANDTKVANTALESAAQNQVVSFDVAATLYVGNYWQSNFVGMLSYAALYQNAMPRAQVAHNYSVLSGTDDPLP